ncbi:MAG: sugar ABC transporter ATP-binding protein [Deltaproteobacteria bacterium]|nr:sugar ABC transporter ATP-binding protein [Deltaproteobacteria bacterium]
MIDEKPLLLRVENITKRFPGVLALDRVDFFLRAGEVHVLFGENGAGKSTLNKIIAGSYFPDEGDLFVGEEKVIFRNPHDARSKGISTVYQEFSLVPQLTVVENMFLGQELVKGGFLDKETMVSRARESLSRLGFNIDPLAPVETLRRAESQMVEIAKAIQQKMSILILDEPTASLTDKEVEHLFALIRKLKSEGVGIIYISHRINELKKIGDRITVLRDGRRVATLEMAKADEQKLISLMTGREYEDIFPEITNTPGRVVLSVENLSSASGLHHISFNVREGEILGIAGLVGAGKSRVGRAVYGLEEIKKGTIGIDGQVLKKLSPAESLKRGILYLPPDRHKEGLVLCRSIKENQTLCSVPLFERRGLIELKREEKLVKKLIDKMKIRPPEPDQTIIYLSGGNQQKVMIARGLTRDIKIFIFDEATCGIDVGAKTEVYQFLKELAEKGSVVIFISSEIQELIHLCHRVMVMHDNTISRIFTRAEATEENILSACFGYQMAAAPLSPSPQRAAERLEA